MINSSITRILLLDSDQSWCEPVSIYISQRLENVGCPCQVIVAHDREHAFREVESQAPHLVRYHPQSGWLDECDRPKGGRPSAIPSA